MDEKVHFDTINLNISPEDEDPKAGNGSQSDLKLVYLQQIADDTFLVGSDCILFRARV